MNKETKIKFITGISIIVIVIISLVILNYLFKDLISTLLNILIFLIIGGPVIIFLLRIARDEIRSEQIKMMEKVGKYLICPKCKEIVDKETGICPSCGYKV